MRLVLITLFFQLISLGLTLPAAAADLIRLEGFLEIPDLYSYDMQTSRVIYTKNSSGVELKSSPTDDATITQVVKNGGELEYWDLSMGDIQVLVYAVKLDGRGKVWAKVSLKDKSKMGWIKIQPEMTYESLVDRLQGHARTTLDWDTVLIDGLGFGSVSKNVSEQLNSYEKIKTYKLNDRSGYEVKVVDKELYQGEWWLQVIFHTQSYCGSALHPRTTLVGWIRLYNDKNQLNVSFPQYC